MPQLKSKEGTQLNHTASLTWKILTEIANLCYPFNFKGTQIIQ